MDYWESTENNPNLRRDIIYVARSGGNDAAKFFWGFIGLCIAGFWPLGVHGTGGVVAKAAWWGFLGVCVVVAAVLASLGAALRRRGAR
jgi:hypothetical protein